jgi:hypothetical protein
MIGQYSREIVVVTFDKVFPELHIGIGDIGNVQSGAVGMPWYRNMRIRRHRLW